MAEVLGLIISICLESPQQQQQQLVHKHGAVDAKVQVTATLAETMSPSNTKVIIKLTAVRVIYRGSSNVMSKLS